MKLGVIGTGKIVKEFLPLLKDMPQVELVGLLSTPRSVEKAKELALNCHVPHVVTGLEELLTLDLDTIYVAVPNDLHAALAAQVIRAGKNVIVEKPMTANANEAQELARLAEENGVFLFEAITTPYLDSFQKIQEWLPEIGKVKHVLCHFCQYSSRYDAFRSGTVMPAFDPAHAGGALMDLNLYNLHFVTGLFGMPEQAEYHAHVERGIDTNGTALLHYAGFDAVCTAAKDCSAPALFCIQGEDGFVTAEYAPNLLGRVTLHKNNGQEESYDGGCAAHRCTYEFAAFDDMMRRGDRQQASERLQASLRVAELMNSFRNQAGIVFPADQA